MKSFLAAIRFLTIVPVPGTWGTTEEDLRACIPWFPVVGLLLGMLAAAAAWGLGHGCPPLLLAALMPVLLLGFSGALHMDGLSDTADGFLSSRPRERILEIMKDSHVGAMGVIAIVCVLLLKFAAIASLPAERVWQTVLLMPLAGRCAIVLNMVLLSSARPGGLGALFSSKRPWLSCIWAILLLFGVAWQLLHLRGIVAGAVVLLIATLFAYYCRRKIGGSTGDTFGAVCEITEMVPAIVLCFPGGG